MIYRRVSEPTEFFDTQGEAVRAGFRRARGQRFLVKQVLKQDREIFISWLQLVDQS